MRRTETPDDLYSLPKGYLVWKTTHQDKSGFVLNLGKFRIFIERKKFLKLLEEMNAIK